LRISMQGNSTFRQLSAWRTEFRHAALFRSDCVGKASRGFGAQGLSFNEKNPLERMHDQ
jgi:hypothetical protein